MSTIENTNILNAVKQVIKPVKGLTYHKRSMKYQVQVFYKDSNQDTTTKKHIFKSKSFWNVKAAVVGRNQIINDIIALYPENTENDFKRWTFNEVCLKSPAIFSLLSGNLENENIAPVFQPRTNEECYICLCEFEDDDETESICGNSQHHIHSACRLAAQAADQTSADTFLFGGHLNTSGVCGICRQPGTAAGIDQQAKARNRKRQDFRGSMGMNLL